MSNVQFKAFINLSDLFNNDDIFFPLNKKCKDIINRKAISFLSLKVVGPYYVHDFINCLRFPSKNEYGLNDKEFESIQSWIMSVEEDEDLMGIEIVLDYDKSLKQHTSKHTKAFLPEEPKRTGQHG